MDILFVDKKLPPANQFALVGHRNGFAMHLPAVVALVNQCDLLTSILALIALAYLDGQVEV
jgi:hypothetical protein